ncbi:hypothetical protein KFK09_026364 [Dendrobium nobile]|uniref:Uncharacterized protein n=1 Tax=Dendrobium nobile TaxID=94219 RepID=A0A8T3A7Q7_DENNO|nr:hypothetical protein KFK09_026364 [Dendrobium nobile]
MHDHGMNDYFQKHPHFYKENDSLKHNEGVVAQVFSNPIQANLEDNTSNPPQTLKDPMVVNVDDPLPSIPNDVSLNHDRGVIVQSFAFPTIDCEKSMTHTLASIEVPNIAIVETTPSCTFNQNVYESNGIMLTSTSSYPLNKHEVFAIQVPWEEDEMNDVPLEDGEFVSMQNGYPIFKCIEVLVVRNRDPIKVDSMFMENEFPQHTSLSEHSSVSKTFSTTYYNSDVLTDTKDMQIAAKYFAKDDNDFSFSKVHSKRGRKPKHISLQPPRSTRSHTSH